MSGRYFRFLSPSDVHVERMLNTAIFILNPKEKWRAHITLAGPFENKKLLSDKDNGPGGRVSVMGAGAFFSEKQCTVYLKTDGPGLKSLWNKPDYGFSPHMTLYDGKNFSMARILLEKLNAKRLYFHFPETIVYTVNAGSGQGRMDLLSGSFSTGVMAVDALTHEEVLKFSDEKRVSTALLILERVKMYSYYGRTKLPGV